MHRYLLRAAAHAAILSASIFSTVVPSVADGFLETDLVANKSPLKDSNGVMHTPAVVDINLVNPWGVGESANSPFWVADNGSGVSTLYVATSTSFSVNPLVVSIPAPSNPLGRGGTPTGLVFNLAQQAPQKAFQIKGFAKDGTATSAPAVFLFATEDGTIVGWNPGVNPLGFDPAKAGTYGIIAVDSL